MKQTLLRLAFLTTISAVTAATPMAAPAQGPGVAPSGVVPTTGHRVAADDLRVPTANLRELSRHAGWGGLIGGALGLAYGLAFARGEYRQLAIIWDSAVGATAGLVVGAGVYLVKFLRETR